MALVADGSRICDASRVALAAINADFTLTSNAVPFIYAGGVDLAITDRIRADTTGRVSWFWRRLGGTFAAVVPGGEIEVGFDTSLVEGTGLTNANKRTTQTATSISAAIPELEGSSSAQPLVEVRDEQSFESQIALSALNANPNTQYEMMLRCVHDLGTTDVTFVAKFTTSSSRAHYPDFRKFPSPEIVENYNRRLRF